MVVGRVRRWRDRWQARSRLQKIDLYSRATLCVLVWFLMATWSALPLLSGLRDEPLHLALGAALLAVNIAQCVVSNRSIGPAFDHYLGTSVFPRVRLVAPLVLLGVAVALVAALVAVNGIEDGGVAFLMMDIPLALTIPYSLLVPVRTFLLQYVVFAALHFGVFAAVGVRGGALAALLPMLLLSCFLTVVTVRPGAWSLQVMWQAEEARDVQARLAVAEERLRFGRDMHDVLGRNLAVIALKSELAVQLAQRGRPEAVAQMVEVQRIAREAQKELREVVRGYREASLGVELEGAQSVLKAAGIDCRIEGDGRELPEAVQSALGWVVREATTNVLRHGDARRCTISLAALGGRVALVVENDGLDDGLDDGATGADGMARVDAADGMDGVRGVADAPGTPGSGLAGLRERLAALDGTLGAGRTDKGLFRLTAKIPLPQEAR
ncbi:histidine kinase [Streptomyces sp. NBC_01142]|nr:histidine kinase [Streptomyces sp. NBC_01142]